MSKAACHTSTNSPTAVRVVSRDGEPTAVDADGNELAVMSPDDEVLHRPRVALAADGQPLPRHPDCRDSESDYRFVVADEDTVPNVRGECTECADAPVEFVRLDAGGGVEVRYRDDAPRGGVLRSNTREREKLIRFARTLYHLGITDGMGGGVHDEELEKRTYWGSRALRDLLVESENYDPVDGINPDTMSPRRSYRPVGSIHDETRQAELDVEGRYR